MTMASGGWLRLCEYRVRTGEGRVSREFPTITKVLSDLSDSSTPG